MGKTLLLTGDPGIGKTTIIRKALKVIGDRAAGFYTEEITGPGGRKGFRIVTLDGRSGILAHKDFQGPKVPQVGRYGVDLAVLERVGVAALRAAIAGGKWMVVDEIGTMELFSHAFQEVVMQAILGPTLVLGSILRHPHPEGDVFKGLAQVTLWEIEKRDRDATPQRVLKWLEKKQ